MSENATAADAVVGADAAPNDTSAVIATATLARTNDPTPELAEPTFDEAIKDLQQAAKAAEAAERQHRRVFVELCTKLFKFKHNRDAVAVEAWLEEKGLKVTAKANEWTAVVKLAFAVEQKDKTWTVSNQQVNKYTNVMRYAELRSVVDMEQWIGDRTLTEMIAAARLALREKKDDDDDDDKPSDKIERYLGSLAETWKPFFEKGFSKVDMNQAPIQDGPIQIMANVDAAGKIAPVGILQVDQPKLLNLLTPPKSKTPIADDLSQSLSGVKTLYRFADLLPMNASIERTIILDVAKDNWRMYACEPGLWSCPIAEATFAQPHQQLPAGKWFLDSAKQKALTFLLNNFPAEMIKVTANKKKCVVTIEDSENKTVEEHVAEISERKERSWRSAKEKRTTEAKEPSKFEFPEEAKGGILELPDASSMDVAKPNKSIKWMDTEIAASRQFRNDVGSFCEKAKSATFYKVRFGSTRMPIFHTHGGGALTIIKYGKKAKTGLRLFFSIDRLLLSRAMQAINFAIGSSACRILISDKESVLRFSAEHNGGEYNIYIPKAGTGFDFAGEEFSMGRLA